jgi:predicted nucleic acid-binding Zn ribbon protein
MPFFELKRILESVLKESKLTSDVDAYRVFSLWGEIAGPTVALHSRPVRLSGSTLYIEIDDAIWLAQLKYMKRDILRKIDQRIKPGIFKDLKLFLK